MTNGEDDAYRRLEGRSRVRDERRADDDRIASIVEEKLDKRIGGWLWLGLFFGLVWWQGWLGFAMFSLTFIGATVYTKWIEDRTPGSSFESDELLVEDYLRHKIIAELYERGELKWELVEGEVVVADHEEWGTYWDRLEQVLPKFEVLSPLERQEKFTEAKRQSLAARMEMMQLASRNHAKPVSWAQTGTNEVF